MRRMMNISQLFLVDTTIPIANRSNRSPYPEIVEEYHQILQRAKFVELPISSVHALRAGSLLILFQST
jgi:hypothetical protein